MELYSSVILVNAHDHPTGVMDKMEAHRRGLLHRAVSAFVFNSKGQWLLQKRAVGKYHSGGLWSNTCCTHPMPDETAGEAIKKRLKEEVGISLPLKEVFAFTYRARLDHGLTEYEYDHIFRGYSDVVPCLNLEEAEEWKYMSTEELELDIRENPYKYTEWFRKVYRRVSACK